MKFLFASDSFKGSLSSVKTGILLEKAAKEIFPSCICESVSVADGGEGTLDAIIKTVKGELIPVEVHDPLMRKKTAYYGKMDESRAIVEMALASGYTLVPEQEKNPLYTTSYGTGELIKDALDKGFRQIHIAIGGSATNDGGMGCMRALGIRFLDSAGKELDGTGAELERVARIDCSGLDPRIRQTKFTVMCDVTNPLCGKNGATYTFGKQKGGTPEILCRMENGMCNYREVIKKELGINADEITGAGAAGGLGAALMVFLNAKMRSGIETVLDLINFEKYLEGVSLVVTGEGRTDWQSCYGKVMQGVGECCRKHEIPVVGLVGSMGKGAEDIYNDGVESLMTTVNAVMCLDDALDNAEKLYYEGALRMFRLIRTGMKMR